MTAQALVSVDLDDLWCYHAIHGLEPPSEVDAVTHHAWQRFLDLFKQLNLKVTFFVIGRSLDAAPVRATLMRALREGHELGNHTQNHPYNLVRLPPSQCEAELLECDRRLRDFGVEPVGFRAPGYVHNRALLRQVETMGYRYDSSKLPSVPYLTLKTLAIGWHRFHRRLSHSQIGNVQTFVALPSNRLPHRTKHGPVELPISTVCGIPAGMSVWLSRVETINDWLQSILMQRDYVHIALHGIDLLDPECDSFDTRLLRWQPELRRSLPVKLERLRRLLSRFAGRDCRLKTASEPLIA